MLGKYSRNALFCGALHHSIASIYKTLGGLGHESEWLKQYILVDDSKAACKAVREQKKHAKKASADEGLVAPLKPANGDGRGRIAWLPLAIVYIHELLPGHGGRAAAHRGTRVTNRAGGKAASCAQRTRNLRCTIVKTQTRGWTDKTVREAEATFHRIGGEELLEHLLVERLSATSTSMEDAPSKSRACELGPFAYRIVECE